MHLCAGVVERRDAEEHIVLGLAVVILLDLAGMHQALVIVQDRLREARRAGGEIDRSIVRIGQDDRRRIARTVCGQRVIAFRKAGTALSDIEQHPVIAERIDDLLDSADEFRPEHQNRDIRQPDTVFDLVCGIAEIQRNRQRTDLQDAEIDRQPLDAVHQKNADLVALLHAARYQEMRESVCFFVKDLPGDLAAVVIWAARLDQFIFLPCDAARLDHGGVQLDQRGIVAVERCILFQYISDRHLRFVLSQYDCRGNPVISILAQKSIKVK